MKSRISLLLLFHFVLLGNQGQAQQTSFRRPDGVQLSSRAINNVIQNLLDSADVAGLCLGIVNGHSILFVKGYGYKNKATGTLNDSATCFYAASLAKPLFAYLVMQLVDENKISLDKPLYTYLPKPLPAYSAYTDLEGDQRWKLITARHCLSHTTGFPNWRFLNAQTGAYDEKGKLAIYFTPGERYAYSGEGLVLLQLVVERITGQSLEQLAQQRVFKPLGMQRTSFLWQPAFESDFALGHNMNGDTIPKDRRTEANAAGSMETTIADYTRFVAAILQGKGLSKKSREEMLSLQIPIYTKRQFPSLNTDTTSENKRIDLGYGLGWGLFKSSYGKAFFKEGHGEGWQHYVIGFPEKQYAAIILTNSDNGESLFKQLVEELTGVTIPYQWEGYTPFRATVKLPGAILQQYTGVYEGKLRATVSLVNGQLKVESETVGLPKTNLYAAKENHFFLKVMETEIQFVKGADGKIEKAIVDDEGEHYELKKIR
jgi:CubicO group peptidase (beta-lactamase class C family)